MFSENLKRLQEEHKVTDYRLAKEIGVMQTSVSNWKKGIKPHLKNAKRVADFFGVPLCEMEE